jgi:hypothetical protein
MAESVTVVGSGGVLVTESLDNTGTPLTPTTGARPVTIGSGGPEVTFVSAAGVLWPGGVEPGSGGAPTLQFDDEINSQLLVLLEDF